MRFVSCSISEQFVNPLFEVFDGGDFILSSWRDIEEPLTRMRIYFEREDDAPAAEKCLKDALSIVGVETEVEIGELPDEDWKLAYRRHFKIEEIGRRLVTVPAWEKLPEGGRIPVVLDPGMAFGTGKHETTKCCLEFIDELSEELDGSQSVSFLDMGCGSGILSIAAAKLGWKPVIGFDVDQEAIDASCENAAANGVSIEFFKYGLGAKVRRALPVSDLVVANILGPLLIRFAGEIVPAVGSRLIVSGILNELYPEVRAAYEALGLVEVAHKSLGEWSTGLLRRV